MLIVLYFIITIFILVSLIPILGIIKLNMIKKIKSESFDDFVNNREPILSEKDLKIVNRVKNIDLILDFLKNELNITTIIIFIEAVFKITDYLNTNLMIIHLVVSSPILLYFLLTIQTESITRQ